MWPAKAKGTLSMTERYMPIICPASAATIAGRHVQVTDATSQTPARASHVTETSSALNYGYLAAELVLIASITALFFLGLHEVVA